MRVRGAVSVKERSSIHAASAASGRFTKKIQRQLRYWEKTPPSSGPSTDDSAHTLAR